VSEQHSLKLAAQPIRSAPIADEQGIWKRIIYMFEMSDPKFWPMMLLPCLIAYIATESYNFWLVSAAIVVGALLNLAAVLLNMYMDRQADRINMPAAANMIDQMLGYRRVWTLAIVLYVALGLTAGVTMLINLQLGIASFLGLAFTFVYSAGPRLKQYIVLSRLIFASGPLISFAIGWVLGQSFFNMPPMVWLLAYSHAMHLSLKDVPDREGDSAMGVRTLFTNLSRKQLGRLLPLLMISPHILTAAMVALDIISRNYLWMLVLAPFALLVAKAPLAAVTQRDRELTREVAQLYTTVYISLLLYIFYPTTMSLVILIGALIFRLVLTAWKIDRRRQEIGLGDVFAYIGQVALQPQSEERRNKEQDRL